MMSGRLVPLVVYALSTSVAAAQDGGDAPPMKMVAGATAHVAPMTLATAEMRLPAAEMRLPGAAATMSGAGIMAGTNGLAVKEEKGGWRFTLSADVLFDFDKADLRPEADAPLRALVEQVRGQAARARYQVEGHTDAKGSDAYNDPLSTRRASAVQAWLTSKAGVSTADVVVAGYGKRRPVVPNTKPDGSDDPEGRQKNRRVEILVMPLQ